MTVAIKSDKNKHVCDLRGTRSCLDLPWVRLLKVCTVTLCPWIISPFKLLTAQSRPLVVCMRTSAETIQLPPIWVRSIDSGRYSWRNVLTASLSASVGRSVINSTRFRGSCLFRRSGAGTRCLMEARPGGCFRRSWSLQRGREAIMRFMRTRRITCSLV